MTTDDQGISAAASRMLSKIGAARELKKLPELLAPNEVVRQMTTGVYGKGTGLLVLTDRRLLFVQDGRMSKTSEDFPLANITSIQWSSGLMFGAVTVLAMGTKAEIKNVNKGDGQSLVDLVRSVLANGTAASQQLSSAVPSPVVDIADQLSKLADLRDRGVLSDDEFAEQKARLLT